MVKQSELNDGVAAFECGGKEHHDVHEYWRHPGQREFVLLLADEWVPTDANEPEWMRQNETRRLVTMRGETTNGSRMFLTHANDFRGVIPPRDSWCTRRRCFHSAEFVER